MKLEDGWAGFIKTMINEIKRIFCNPLIYASIVVGLIVINRPLIEVLWSGVVESGSISQFLSIPLATSDFTPFAAVFCALPFAASFCDDYNSGNYLYIISRSGTKKYVAIKSLSVALSGGVTMAGIMLGTIIFCGVLADSPDTPEKISFMRNSIWVRSGIIYIANGYFYLFMRVLFAFLFGCVWASVGLLVSIVYTNKYVAYISPFVVYQFLWFVFSETKWNPVYLLRGDSNFIPSLSFVLIYQVTSLSLLLIASFVLIRRKVRL